MPKVPRPAQANGRHNPLAEEYSATQAFKTKAPKKRNRKDENEEDNVIDTKASRKILKIGQELADEEEAERKTRFPAPPNPAFAFETRFPQDVESEDENDKWDDEQEAWGEEEETFEVEVWHKILVPVLYSNIEQGNRRQRPRSLPQIYSAFI
jgi:essential nuclear protein 1